MITFSFLIAALVYTLGALVLTPVCMALDLIIAIIGALSDRSRTEIENDMLLKPLWEWVRKAWKKVND